MLAAGVVALLTTTVPTARAATELTLVYPFPDFLIYTKLCKELADKINKAAGGSMSIKVMEYNSIGMFKQPNAVSKGRVDMACTPAAFYARGLPENEAVATSNSSPATVRANGGFKILDDLHQKHMNMKYLGWTESGGLFRIYTKDAPKFTAAGLPDFNGIKLRDNPIYGAFFRALNATTHSMKSSEVYAALEKGVVNASAWATIGLKGLKWDKFLRHGIEPEFYQTDIGWIMNLDSWNKLDAAQQKLLQNAVIEHENYAREKLQGMAAEERKTLETEGMVFHKVPAGDAYLKVAIDSAYDRMMERLKKAGRPTDHVAKLRDAFQD
ncbi:MAG: TRAP transporter substrate-binding protein DctP [Pseudomonadota bacterium]